MEGWGGKRPTEWDSGEGPPDPKRARVAEDETRVAVTDSLLRELLSGACAAGAHPTLASAWRRHAVTMPRAFPAAGVIVPDDSAPAAAGAGAAEDAEPGWMPTDEDVQLSAAKLRSDPSAALRRLKSESQRTRQTMLDIIGEL